MTEPHGTHTWGFAARFRRHAFGWKSQPAITRVKQALAEIKKVARCDPLLAATGAVRFLEKVSPAVEHVDSSSGAIGSAVRHAITELVAILAAAPVDTATRQAWLERLWQAYQEDEVPYLEALGEYWGELCATKDLADFWADRLAAEAAEIRSPGRAKVAYWKGDVCLLGALVAAGRYDEVHAHLATAPQLWFCRRFGMLALAAQGRPDEAVAYAEASRNPYDGGYGIDLACEALLLSMGRVEEAYRRFGLVANQGTTYLATFRAVLKKYPHKPAPEVLADLVRTTPGDGGKWFAAAKDAGLFAEALQLAAYSPCDPRTLARAARDHGASHPAFAVEAGILALYWIVAGHGYEIEGVDVFNAYESTVAAAENLGAAALVTARVRELLARGGGKSDYVASLLKRELGA